MEQSIHLENQDFKLEIKKLTKETRELGMLANKIISNEINQKETTTKQHMLPKRKKDGKFAKDLPKDARIDTHGRMPVYKEIIDNILKSADDRITMNEMEGIIREFYKNKLKKQITDGTAKTYASVYSNGLVNKKKLERITRNIFSKDAEKNKIDEKKKMDVAERIYQLSQERGWGGKNSIRIKTIADELQENEDAIKSALVELFKRNKATQWPNDMVRFNG
jgi:hypothetical protein